MVACYNHLFWLIPSINQDFVSNDAPPDSLMDYPKVKTTKGKEVGARPLARGTLRVDGCVRAPRWGLRRVTSKSITHMDLHKPNNNLVSA